MANEQTPELATHLTLKGDERTAHLKDLAGTDRMMKHLVEVHGVKNVPVSKAQQAKAHMALHPAPVAPAPEPTPAPAPEVKDGPAEDHAEPIGPMTPQQMIEHLQAQLLAAQARPAKAATFGAPEAKNALFTAAVKVLDELVANLKDDDPIVKVMGRADAARTMSQAIHHFATGRDAEGKRVWPATTLPKPQRSDWR